MSAGTLWFFVRTRMSPTFISELKIWTTFVRVFFLFRLLVELVV